MGAGKFIAIGLGAIAFIIALAINGTGTQDSPGYGVVELDASFTSFYNLGNFDVDFSLEEYVGVWKVVTVVKSNGGGVSHTDKTGPDPLYCNQDQDNKDNNCPIGRANYDSDCCKAYARSCKADKAMAVLVTLFSLGGTLTAFKEMYFIGGFLSLTASICFIGLIALYTARMEGDYWKQKGSEVNKGDDCGVNGYSAVFALSGWDTKTYNLDYEYSIGFILIVLGAVASLSQALSMFFMKWQNKDDSPQRFQRFAA